jgi:hypothetical protein
MKRLATVVIVSNRSGQEGITKFDNITMGNGDFSIKYLFSDLRIYEVILQIHSDNPASVTLASFKVVVTQETSLSNIITTAILIVIIFGGISYVVIIIKRKQDKKNMI